MNILHVSRQYLPVIGGTEIVMHDFASEQTNLGHNCKILCINRNIHRSEDGYFSKFEVIDGIEVHRIRAYGSYKKPIPCIFDFFRILKLLMWADIVHLHDMRFLFEMVCFCKFFLKYKIFLSTNGFIHHTSEFNKVKKILFNSYYFRMFNLFLDKILAISERDLNLIDKVSNNKKILFESALKTQKYFDIDKKVIKNNFLYFGRIDKNKGIENLFKVLCNIENDWILNIVGTGDSNYINSLKILSNKLKIENKLNWLGKLPENKLFEEISKAHIAFFPSLEEGFGLTFLESLATNTITIGNKIPTFQKILKDINAGIVVDFSNVQETINIINEIIMNSDKLTANIIHSNFIKYDIKTKINSLIDLYQRP